LLRTILEPFRPRIALVYLFALSPAVAVLAVAPAHAAVVEPNGITVPAPPITTSCQTVTCPVGKVCENGRCEVRLQSYFDANGEAISETVDASTDPGVFLPLCDFAATLVLSESQADGGLAWYNVPATGASTTAPAAIYQIGPFPMLVGQVITSTDVRTNPNYAGGLIGFVLLKSLGQPMLSRVYYSEYALNVRCTGTGCPMPGNWKMALSYLSKANPNSYYLAFEDWEGADQNSWQGNDGDFNDKVFKISGVTCDGGGEPCDTGMPGVCARGVTQCQVGAGISCKPAVIKGAERCDNLDNDCNDMVDDGDGLCTQANFVCSKGVCIPKCDDSEFPCGPGLKCDTDGLCKDPRCATLDCPAGQVCQAGTCVGGCQGVTCPLGQICQLGVCVDPCAGVSCPGGVCDKGACVTACRCRACGTGKVCAMGGPLDGQCVDTGCDKMTCTTGTICSKGACVDACANAVCPGAVECKNGMCDPAPPVTPTGQGGTTGSGGFGGFILTGRGGTTGSGGIAGGGARGGNGGAASGAAGASGGTLPARGPVSACSCSLSRAPATGGLVFLLAAAATALVRRRRR
jgi:hypothetical protein